MHFLTRLPIQPLHRPTLRTGRHDHAIPPQNRTRTRPPTLRIRLPAQRRFPQLLPTLKIKRVSPALPKHRIHPLTVRHRCRTRIAMLGQISAILILLTRARHRRLPQLFPRRRIITQQMPLQRIRLTRIPPRTTPARPTPRHRPIPRITGHENLPPKHNRTRTPPTRQIDFPSQILRLTPSRRQTCLLTRYPIALRPSKPRPIRKGQSTSTQPKKNDTRSHPLFNHSIPTKVAPKFSSNTDRPSIIL